MLRGGGSGTGERCSSTRWAMLCSGVLLLGCSGDSTGVADSDAGDSSDARTEVAAFPELVCPFDYGAYTPSTAPSFATDVFPIFEQNCNALSCHGASATTTPHADLTLGFDGPDPTPAELDTIHAELLSDSVTVPALKRVAPGDPGSSFLLIKLDGCQDRLSLECTRQEGGFGFTDCGDRMPQAQLPLSEEVRNVLRDWILAGAAND